MGYSGEVKGCQATCVRSGATVFKGAVIGQVFTGEVQIQCPYAALQGNARQEAVAASRESGRPLSTALIALAIWQVVYAPDNVEGLFDSPMSNAAIFLVAGMCARYLKPLVARCIMKILVR